MYLCAVCLHWCLGVCSKTQKPPVRSSALLGHNRRMPPPKTQRKNFVSLCTEENNERVNATHTCTDVQNQWKNLRPTRIQCVILLHIPVKIANSLRQISMAKLFRRLCRLGFCLSLWCKSLHVRCVTSFNENRSKWTSAEQMCIPPHTYAYKLPMFFFVELCRSISHICRRRCVRMLWLHFQREKVRRSELFALVPLSGFRQQNHMGKMWREKNVIATLFCRWKLTVLENCVRA